MNEKLKQNLKIIRRSLMNLFLMLGGVALILYQIYLQFNMPLVDVNIGTIFLVYIGLLMISFGSTRTKIINKK